MAFGKNIATASDKAQERLAERNLDDHGVPLPSDQEAAPRQAPSPSAAPVASAPTPTGRPGGFNRPSVARPAPVAQAPQPTAAPASPSPVQSPARPRAMAPSPAPVASSRPTSARESAENAPRVSTPPPRETASRETADNSSVSTLFDGYRQMLITEMSRRPDGLPLRMERLIDEISDFHGYSKERTEEAKRMALTDLAAWEKKLTDHYRNVIRPARQQTAQTLEEARQKHPGKGVFIMVAQGKSTIQLIDPSNPEHKNMGIMNGATVERVASSRTPFRTPWEVFGRKETINTLEAGDEAFGGDAAPVRTPRP